MSNLKKEQKYYMQGLKYAYELVKAGGVEALEHEIQYRGLNNLPLNVNSQEIRILARQQAKYELEIMATASADALSNYLKFPPTVVKEYLRVFNQRMEDFRMDQQEFKKTAERLNKNLAMNDMCRQFMEEK